MLGRGELGRAELGRGVLGQGELDWEGAGLCVKSKSRGKKVAESQGCFFTFVIDFSAHLQRILISL